MMIKYFYSVYDSTANTFTDPMVLVSDNVAIRSFSIEAKNSESIINRFPTDFTLYCHCNIK